MIFRTIIIMIIETSKVARTLIYSNLCRKIGRFFLNDTIMTAIMIYNVFTVITVRKRRSPSFRTRSAYFILKMLLISVKTTVSVRSSSINEVMAIRICSPKEPSKRCSSIAVIRSTTINNVRNSDGSKIVVIVFAHRIKAKELTYVMYLL